MEITYAKMYGGPHILELRFSIFFLQNWISFSRKQLIYRNLQDINSLLSSVQIMQKENISSDFIFTIYLYQYY